MSKETKSPGIKVDKRAIEEALRNHANQPPPDVAYKVNGINGDDVFEHCLLQFGKMPEVAGFVFVVANDNPNNILAAYAPGTWSRAVIVPEAELAQLKAKASGLTVEELAEIKATVATPGDNMVALDAEHAPEPEPVAEESQA